MWICKWVTILATLSLWVEPTLTAKKFKITIGYLPCLRICGALSLALEDVNARKDLLPDVELLLELQDTTYNTSMRRPQVIDMISKGVVAFIGPEGDCESEAITAVNLPMIAYRCFSPPTSASSNAARLDPPGAKATKAVISLLRYYKWNKFSILYEESWMTAALTLEKYATSNNMTVNHRRLVIDGFKCCADKLACCSPGYWYRSIQETKDSTRIYVFLGSTPSLIEMMTAMESLHLFANGQYMVIFVDMMSYSPADSFNHLLPILDRLKRNFVCPNTKEFNKRARSLLVVMSSKPDSNYEQFSTKVRKYNGLPPCNRPDIFPDIKEPVLINAAYLYDSVKLYAEALDKIIKEETVSESLTYEKLLSLAKNGPRIVQQIVKSSPYRSISGVSIRLDENAYSEGNFSVLAYKPMNEYASDFNCSHGMIPVGHFQESINKEYLEFKINPRLSIDWVDGVKPEASPDSPPRNTKLPSFFTNIVKWFTGYELGED